MKEQRSLVKNSRPLGTEFTNSAAIYFDYNAPVITNTTKNTLSAVGIEDFAAAKTGLKIFPNPAGQQFSVVTDFGRDENAMITVTNTQGQVVLSQNAIIGSGAQQTSVNTGNLASGIYFVTLQSATVSQTAKVVIVK